jgi:hypothetical protein
MGFLKDLFVKPLTLGDSEDPASRVSRASGLRTPGEATADVSGLTAVEAIREGQRLQEEFGREALQQTVEGQFGASPVLQDLTQFAQGQIAGNPALANLPQEYLDQSAMLTGADLLGRERGDLLNAIGIGQASAAQQAAGLMDVTGQRQDLLSQIGNVQAAGGIGQAQAFGQGAQNIAGIGTALAQQFGR